MKKYFCFILAVILLLSLFGCTDKPVTPSSSGAVSVIDTSSATEILKPDVTLSDAELAAAAAKNLGVPNDPAITYEIDEMFLWEAAETYCKNITFYKNGKIVAGASVDAHDGQLMRNIHKFENFYYFFKDP